MLRGAGEDLGARNNSWRRIIGNTKNHICSVNATETVLSLHKYQVYTLLASLTCNALPLTSHAPHQTYTYAYTHKHTHAQTHTHTYTHHSLSCVNHTCSLPLAVHCHPSCIVALLCDFTVTLCHRPPVYATRRRTT